MQIVIRAVSLDGRPLAEPLLGVFDRRGGTIGRSQANTLSLPDTERRISRLQAEVSTQDERCVIRNAGSLTPIVVAGRSLAPGGEAPLNDGDHLLIGGYELLASIKLDAPEGASSAGHVAVGARSGSMAGEPTTHPPQDATAPAAPASTNPFAELLGGLPSSAASDPFADLLGPADSSGATAPLHRAAATPQAPRASTTPAMSVPDDPFAFLDAQASAVAVQPALQPQARLPDDFDLFADPTSSTDPVAPPRPAVSPPSEGADLLAMVGAGTSRTSSLDESFGLGSLTHGADPLGAFLANTATSSAQGATLSPDPLALFADAPARSTPAPRNAAIDHVAELQGAFTPPRVLPRPIPSSPTASPANASAGARQATAAAPSTRPARGVAADDDTLMLSGAGSATSLWSAFCVGAGVQVALPQGLAEAQMTLLGQLLSTAVAGALPLARRTTDWRADGRAGAATAAAAPLLNPLALAADTSVALELLLLPARRGFLDGPMAMQDLMRRLGQQLDEPALTAARKPGPAGKR